MTMNERTDNQAESPERYAPSTDDASQHADPIERLKAELSSAKDQTLRALADVDNVRKRARKEMDEVLKYGNLPLMHDLLPVIDNLGRAIEAADKTPDVASLLAGMKMVAQQLQEALARSHCLKISALHQPFDPHRHAALMQQPSAEQAANTVLAVLQDGFQLHDRVIRPAQVVVSTGPATK